MARVYQCVADMYGRFFYGDSKMVEQNKDLNSGGSVATQDLKEAGAVNQQDLNQSVTDEQDERLADGSKKSEKTVKYEEFEKANAAKKEAEEALLLSEQKLAQSVQLQMQAAQQQQAQQTVQPGSTFEVAMKEYGFAPDDLYIGENLVKVQNRKSELDAMAQQQQTVFTANQQFIASHPDFTQVVGSVNPATGRIMAWSQEALLLQQKMPYLANLQSAKDVYETVINARKLAELEKTSAANKEHLARQEAGNLTEPLGGSAGGGGGAGDPNSQQLLTREQTQEIIDKLNNGEQV